MECPNCKNKNWKPIEGFERPLKNLGKKEYFKTFITRYYICLNCGYTFQSIEQFYRAVKTRVEKSLFDKEA
jgi:transcriptional regulator NrdR family protein